MSNIQVRKLKKTQGFNGCQIKWGTKIEVKK